MAAERDGARTTGTVVHKVLNNNVVISLDESGRERVLMGRGLGFQLQALGRHRPDEGREDVRARRGRRRRRASASCSATSPTPSSRRSRGAVDEAERSWGASSGRHLTIAVIDHVQYVLERLDQGVRIPDDHNARAAGALPRGVRRGASAWPARSASALERELPPEEAVFLTMHLLNATRDEPNGTAALLFRRVQHVVDDVETGPGRAPRHREPRLRAVHPAHPVPAAAPREPHDARAAATRRSSSSRSTATRARSRSPRTSSLRARARPGRRSPTKNCSTSSCTSSASRPAWRPQTPLAHLT